MLRLFSINTADDVASRKLFFKSADGLCISSSLLDYVFYLSIIVFFVATRFLVLPPVFLALVGAYFFLIVPYVVGQGLCRPFFEHKVIEYFGKASKYFIEWVLGVVSITVLMAILQFLGWNILISNVYIFVLISTAVNIFMNFIGKGKNDFYITFSRKLRYLLFSVLIGIGVVAVIQTVFLHFPDIGFNFDIPYTTYLATARFLDNGFVTLVWRWVEFIMAGTACNLLNLNPLYFIAAAPFALMTLYVVGIYLISYRLFEKPKIAVIAVLAAVFLNAGSIPLSMFVDNLAYVYRSNTILASVFPLSLFVLFEFRAREKLNKNKSAILLFFLLLSTGLFYIFFNTSWVHVEDIGLPVGFLGYVVFPLSSLVIFVVSFLLCYRFRQKSLVFVMGFLAILLLAFYLIHPLEAVLLGLVLSLFIFLSMLSLRYKKILSSFVVYTTVLFCFLQARGVISRPLGLLALTSPLPSSYSVTGFDEKWSLFFDTSHPYNTYLLFFLFAVSAIFLLREKNEQKLTLLSSMWIMLLFFFLPELFTYRSYHILTPLMAITFAYVIEGIAQKTNSFAIGRFKKER